MLAPLPHGGVVNRTPFVILVRPGNPKASTTSPTSRGPGVRVVHPDPLTSGGANWAILAEYGAGLRGGPGGEREAGDGVLLGVWKNVVAQAASARAARTQFENGFGDALVTYEQEALCDRRAASSPRRSSTRAAPSSPSTRWSSIDRNIPPRERALVDALRRSSCGARRRSGSSCGTASAAWTSG